MSSPCLLRATPISQPRLREVKLTLKASSRETVSTARSGAANKEAPAGRPAPAEKEAPPVRVGLSTSRSRSTPPAHRGPQDPKRTAAHRGDGGGPRKQRCPEPEHHPEKNGTLPHPPESGGPAGLTRDSSSSTTTSSSSRRQRPSASSASHQHPHPRPHPPPATPSSNSSSSSAKSMKRARWLSYSASNICFNSILDGRFRQLQGTKLGGWKF